MCHKTLHNLAIVTNVVPLATSCPMSMRSSEGHASASDAAVTSFQRTSACGLCNSPREAVSPAFNKQGHCPQHAFCHPRRAGARMQDQRPTQALPRSSPPNPKPCPTNQPKPKPCTPPSPPPTTPSPQLQTPQSQPTPRKELGQQLHRLVHPQPQGQPPPRSSQNTAGFSQELQKSCMGSTKPASLHQSAQNQPGDQARPPDVRSQSRHTAATTQPFCC